MVDYSAWIDAGSFRPSIASLIILIMGALLIVFFVMFLASYKKTWIYLSFIGMAVSLVVVLYCVITVITEDMPSSLTFADYTEKTFDISSLRCYDDFSYSYDSCPQDHIPRDGRKIKYVRDGHMEEGILLRDKNTVSIVDSKGRLLEGRWIDPSGYADVPKTD